jgi:hypothetical protein
MLGVKVTLNMLICDGGGAQYSVCTLQTLSVSTLTYNTPKVGSPNATQPNYTSLLQTVNNILTKMFWTLFNELLNLLF